MNLRSDHEDPRFRGRLETQENKSEREKEIERGESERKRLPLAVEEVSLIRGGGALKNLHINE